MKNPKIVVFDIETAPMTVFTWDLYPSSLSHDNIITDWFMICAAWKTVGSGKVGSAAIKTVGDDYQVVKSLRDALEDADILVGHYIEKFDIKKLNTRLIYHKLPPLPKIPVVDTKNQAKGVAAFSSNRLDYLSKTLLGQGKMHVDYQLWIDVMKGSKAAVKKMLEYNKIDVIRNEAVYLRLKPYLDKHPHVGVMTGGQKIDCPKCGSLLIQKRGVSVTAVGTKYQRLQCQACHGWHRVPFNNKML